MSAYKKTPRKSQKEENYTGVMRLSVAKDQDMKSFYKNMRYFSY